LNELFFGAVEQFGDRSAALRSKVNGVWTPFSYRQLLERVRAVSLGFAELGIEPGRHIALLSENRPEWAIVDYACLTARCADVPIYPTLPAHQIEFILRNSEAAAICVSTAEQLAKIQEIRERLPELRHVIVFDSDARAPGVRTLSDVAALGRAVADRDSTWRAQAAAVQPDDLATLIYTSGTTGDPKGVMLTHGNIASNVVAALSAFPLRSDDESLSLLPLSHIFERMAGHYCMLHKGVLINYATSQDTVAAEMLETHPTVMTAVPRFYEKVFGRVLEAAMSGSRTRRAIFVWARRNGERWAEYRLAGRPVPRVLAAKRTVADRLVFSKLRARTGGRIRFFVSGGAALAPEIARFFYAAGMPILEGYGLTETSPVIAVNSLEHLKIGTVGRPVPGVEVKIAADGEILTRGPNVMLGYYRDPEATAEAIDADGWFHTGDVGMLDADGFLRITDRKKDLIVTAGGKNIAPQPIENLAKGSKFVSNAVMLGDKRKFPIMLVVPNLEPLRAWAEHKELPQMDDRALLARPEVQEKMDREVRTRLRDLAQFEMPKKLLLLATDFSLESGELTPSLKVRRRVVERNYRDEIEALYAEAPGGRHDLKG
jgi:long-chain acyl-CoA synthetase